MPELQQRLSQYPFVLVRITCDLCGRSGRHRLVRLGAKFGLECPIDDVLARLSADWPARRAPCEMSGQQWKSGCWARFPDRWRTAPAGPPG